jgi:hypothetical protein
MSYVHGTAIKEILSPDGTCRVDIVARRDGTFQYHEHYRAPEVGPTSGWFVGKASGLFDTADAAEQAARQAFGL